MRAILMALLITGFFISSSRANEAGEAGEEAVGIYIENDSRNIGGPGSDGAYTNGVKFSYIYADNRIPEWALPTVRHFDFLEEKIRSTSTNFGLSLGQQIFTPSNTGDKNFIKDDRPYAAWLYLGFMASFAQTDVAQVFEIDAGMVGPSALGEEVQNNFHRAIGAALAKGWKYQLHDEPGLQFFYQRRHRLWESEHLDIIPYYGAGFGNIFDGIHLGALVRWGINLPKDFGPTRPSGYDGDGFLAPGQHTHRPTYYVFGSARATAIARNIFLDGSTFGDTPFVKKYPVVSETEFGAGLQMAPYVLVWRFVTRSPEFEERSRFNSFASINFVYLL